MEPFSRVSETGRDRLESGWKGLSKRSRHDSKRRQEGERRHAAVMDLDGLHTHTQYMVHGRSGWDLWARQFASDQQAGVLCSATRGGPRGTIGRPQIGCFWNAHGRLCGQGGLGRRGRLGGAAGQVSREQGGLARQGVGDDPSTVCRLRGCVAAWLRGCSAVVLQAGGRDRP